MVDENVEGAVAGSRLHFQIWKVWLCQKKNKKKPKYGIIDDKCWVSCFRINGAFPNMESMTVQKQP
jgi:hypothetical protein